MKSAELKVNDQGQIERCDENTDAHDSLMLHTRSPDGQVRELVLRSGSISIGREESCTLRLSDRKVSRRHAEIVLLDGMWTVLDCGSQNGTFLNRVALVEPRRLRPGDILVLGDTTIFVALASNSASRQSSPGVPPALPRIETPRAASDHDGSDSTEIVRTIASEQDQAPVNAMPCPLGSDDATPLWGYAVMQFENPTDPGRSVSSGPPLRPLR